jgi:hypothetical protein
MMKSIDKTVAVTLAVLAALWLILMSVCVHGINTRYANVVEYIEYEATYEGELNFSAVSAALADMNLTSFGDDRLLTFDVGHMDDENLSGHTRCVLERSADGSKTTLTLRCYGKDEPVQAFRLNDFDVYKPRLAAAMAYVTLIIYNETGLDASGYEWHREIGAPIPRHPTAH